MRYQWPKLKEKKSIFSIYGLILRIDSSQSGPFSFFSDYFQSSKDTITCYISSERLYLFLSIGVNHILIIYDA